VNYNDVMLDGDDISSRFFFTMMVHLVLHLATEEKIGGPVCYR